MKVGALENSGFQRYTVEIIEARVRALTPVVCYYDILFHKVEIIEARVRALTPAGKFMNFTQGFCVEIIEARVRALTHFIAIHNMIIYKQKLQRKK